MTLRNYGAATDITEVNELFRRVTDDALPFGFDIETGYLGPDRAKASIHPETAIVVGVSLTNSTDWARYIPLAHDTGPNVDPATVAPLLWALLNTGLGVAQNCCFELRHLSRWFRQHLSDHPIYGQSVREANGYFPMRSDTMVEAYLAAEYQSFGLKYLTKVMFEHQMTELHELFPGLANNRRQFLRFNTLDPADPKVIEYACEDSLWCLAIHKYYYESVSKLFLYQVEMGVLACVCEMEDFGVAYDWNFMRRAADVITEFRDKFNAEIMAELSEMVGSPVGINLGSALKVGEVLYKQLGLKTSVYTDKTRDLAPEDRKMSTGKIALAGLAKQFPVVKRITEWKGMTRLKGTYLEKYDALYNYAEDGRTHPSHLSAFVVTGRFAVADPPYQQSPKLYHYDLAAARAVHEEHAAAHGSKCNCDEYPPPEGTCFRFNFRDAIVAPPGYYMLGFDLSQAELRAIAGEAKEEALLKAFADGVDVHTLTAALMLGIVIEEVTKDQRAIGKTMNFALLYGMGIKGLADRLGVSVEEATSLYNAYFAAYPGIASWSDRQVELGRRDGYVTSRFGRKLPIWEYLSDKRWIQQKGDRACVNYPIQGSATGDYMKVAMVRARAAIREAGLAEDVRLVMNVHDALEFYVKEHLPPQDVIKIIQPAVIFPVPGWPAMKADWHFGRRWGSPVEIEMTDDGRFFAKGETDIELVSTVVVDEDGEEVVQDLPEVPREVIEEVLAAAGTPVTSFELDQDRHAIVELTEMPDTNSYRKFLELLDAAPGRTAVTLRTPEGDLAVKADPCTALSPADAGRVSLLLGPVKIFYDEADVDAAALMDGLTL